MIEIFIHYRIVIWKKTYLGYERTQIHKLIIQIIFNPLLTFNEFKKRRRNNGPWKCEAILMTMSLHL